jgi:hypothetical protein
MAEAVESLPSLYGWASPTRPEGRPTGRPSPCPGSWKPYSVRGQSRLSSEPRRCSLSTRRSPAALKAAERGSIDRSGMVPISIQPAGAVTLIGRASATHPGRRDGSAGSAPHSRPRVAPSPPASPSAIGATSGATRAGMPPLPVRSATAPCLPPSRGESSRGTAGNVGWWTHRDRYGHRWILTGCLFLPVVGERAPPESAAPGGRHSGRGRRRGRVALVGATHAAHLLSIQPGNVRGCLLLS